MADEDAQHSEEDGGPDGAPPPEPTVDDIETGEHDLRALAAQDAAYRKEQSWEVVVRRAGAADVQLALEGTRTVIGRDQGCDIVIAEPEVSRTHAEIVRTEAGYLELRDARSKGGVGVAGMRVKRMILLDGDRFQVGSARFTVRALDP